MMTLTRTVALVIAVLALACARGRRAPAPATTPADSARPVRRDSTPPNVVPVVPTQPVVTPPTDTTARPATPARPDQPGTRCILDVDSDRAQVVKDPSSEKRFTYLGGGVIGRCRGQEITVTSDSAESYEQSRLHYLIGNVKYREKGRTLDADRLTYFQAEERLLAEGNVRSTFPDGTSMTGPRAEYFRAVRGVRPKPRLVAVQRPTMLLVETDSLGQKKEPVTLIADNVIADGDSIFNAWGRVELLRTDVTARGDSAFLDGSKQFARLMKEPVVDSKSDRPYTLKGRIIDMYGASRQVSRIVAIDSANATSEEFELTSDTLDLRVGNNKLERAYAFGPRGARATSAERVIIADSLDVIMPGQRIRELHAVGRAYAESVPDTAKIVSEERDWLRGDTIIAKFDTVASTDTSSQPRMRELTASPNASSFYHIPSDEGKKDKFGVNYVTGKLIRVDFADGEVQAVTVREQASGIYLEPSSDTAGTARPRPQRGTPPRTPPPRRPPGARE
jgi:hypothetical protein